MDTTDHLCTRQHSPDTLNFPRTHWRGLVGQAQGEVTVTGQSASGSYGVNVVT